MKRLPAQVYHQVVSRAAKVPTLYKCSLGREQLNDLRAESHPEGLQLLHCAAGGCRCVLSHLQVESFDSLLIALILV